MKVALSRGFGWVSFAFLILSLPGCGGTEVKLADVPPAAIAPSKEGEATKDVKALKTGAPAKGSSSGMDHNPSETPR